MPGIVLDGAEFRQPALQVTQEFPRPIRASIIDHQNFMGNIVDAKFDMEVFDRGTDATFLVPSRDDDGEQCKRRSFCFWSIGHAFSRWTAQASLDSSPHAA